VKTLILLIVVVLLLGPIIVSRVDALLLGGQGQEIQRLNAEGHLAKAEAEAKVAQAQAEALRQQARAETEASIAATRQMEREAAHQRAMELLPQTALIIVGGVLMLALLLVFFGQTQRRPAVPLGYTLTPTEVERLLFSQAQETRQMWHAIATLQRTLPEGVEEGRYRVVE